MAPPRPVDAAPCRTLADLAGALPDLHPGLAAWSMPGGARRSIADLGAQARTVSANLRALGVERGELVGVLLDNSLDHLAVDLGVWRCGAVLSPLPIPTSPAQVTVALQRLQRLREAGHLRRVVTDLVPADLLASFGVTALDPARLLDGTPEIGDPRVRPDEVALVQFTSGSTAHPKGVVLTHDQALAGTWATVARGGLGPDDRYALWLPLSHDMGLFSTFAHLLAGADVHLASPATFVKRPGAWLAHFAAVRATIYVGPNFSYTWMRDAVPPEAVAGLDLSAWRLALNGAEPVDPALIDGFIRHFAPAGFRPDTMYPVYGLAEATVGVTFPTPGEPPRVDWVERAALLQEREARPCPSGASGARGVVSVGHALPGLELRVTGPDGGVLGDRAVGEIEVRGDSVMSGYHLDPDATAAAFHDGWLRTGDLGYLVGGRLFVTGREKDVIKLRGDSLFPDDLESRIRELPGILRRRCVALGSGDVPERVVVLVESDLAGDDERRGLLAAVRGRLGGLLEPEELDVALVPPKTIPYTTSGKPQRRALRAQLERGELALSR